MAWVDPQAIIDRLEGIDRGVPPLDTERANDALSRHFLVAGMAPPPVRWVKDAEEGVLVAGRSALSRDWAWLDRVARSSAEKAATRSSVSKRVWASAWWLAESVAQSVAGRRARARAGRGGRSKEWARAAYAARSAGRSAARAAVWLTASPEPSTDRSVEIWLPFLDAVAAGLWIYWVLDTEVLAVPRPALCVEDGALHSAAGPAVSWPNGARYWFWHGVQVPARVIQAPETITVGAIRRERNVEVRRVMLERYGHERYLRDAGAQKIHSDDFGTLWRVDLRDDEPLIMVEVVDATPQRDGSFRNYMLRVPPWIRTAQEGVAWTFGRPPHEYQLDLET